MDLIVYQSIRKHVKIRKIGALNEMTIYSIQLNTTEHDDNNISIPSWLFNYDGNNSTKLV